MAHAQQNQNPNLKAPDFLAWHVTQKADKSFWNKVGAAWQHRDGNGYTIQLEVVPINGRIILRQPLETPDNKESA